MRDTDTKARTNAPIQHRPLHILLKVMRLAGGTKRHFLCHTHTAPLPVDSEHFSLVYAQVSAIFHSKMSTLGDKRIFHNEVWLLKRLSLSHLFFFSSLSCMSYSYKDHGQPLFLKKLQGLGNKSNT